nr:MAG TPA: hypothetical protein [Caudoviricetes sp.]
MTLSLSWGFNTSRLRTVFLLLLQKPLHAEWL